MTGAIVGYRANTRPTEKTFPVPLDGTKSLCAHVGSSNTATQRPRGALYHAVDVPFLVFYEKKIACFESH
jgi:hypothetical protein